MKAIHTFALIALGALLMSNTPLRAAEPARRIEVSFNKSRAYQPHVRYDKVKIGDRAGAEANERAGSGVQDEVADRPAPRVGAEVGVQPATIYSSKIELGTKPINVFQWNEHSSVEYSGILVQSLGSNPAQLFNPFAPVQYGDGEANTVRNVITGQAEGLKVLGIHF